MTHGSRNGCGEAARRTGAGGSSAHGLTQMDFALPIGMNVAHLGRIERGEGNPDRETLVRLAHAFDLDVADLVGGIRIEHFPPRKEKRVGLVVQTCTIWP